MKHKTNLSKKALLSTCIFAFLLVLFFSIDLLFSVENGNALLTTEIDFGIRRQQLSDPEENYDCEDTNCAVSVSGFGDMYVLQYASETQVKNTLNRYNPLSYAESAMIDSVVGTQEDPADGEYEEIVSDRLTQGAEILGVASYQRAIGQKYNDTTFSEIYAAVLDISFAEQGLQEMLQKIAEKEQSDIQEYSVSQGDLSVVPGDPDKEDPDKGGTKDPEESDDPPSESDGEKPDKPKNSHMGLIIFLSAIILILMIAAVVMRCKRK